MKREDSLILQPIKIGSMTLKNRLGNAPFGSVPAADADGFIIEESVKNCRSLIESGVGLLITGPVKVLPEKSKFVGSSGETQAKAKKAFGVPSLQSDEYIPSWKMLMDFVHSHDCKLIIQIGDWGPQGLNQMSEQIESYVKYQAFSLGQTAEMPETHTMTVEELDQQVEYMAQACRRAKEAGIDGVEFHSAHSSAMLYANALDPFFNHRDDEYGGDVDRRMHFHIKTIKRMRELVGPDYPILIRINGDDLKGELGNTVDDIAEHIVPRLEAAGFDAIDISAGGPMFATQGPLPPMYYPRGIWLHLAKRIKEKTNLPVIGVGRVTTVEMAEKYLREGWCDIFFMGRQIFADENVLPNYIAGKTGPEDNRQCIACLKPGCIGCTVNYERWGILMPGYDKGNLDKVANPQKMLIIGGGVAGMEAARVAAIKGHKVTLWEKSGVLGGTVGTLATTPLTSEFQNIVDYLMGQLAQLDVEVRCCYEATLERIKAFAPEVCLLAAGADFVMPDYLEDGLMVMTHLEAMKRKREFRSMPPWRKKVVVYGFPAAEFALDLAETGSDVVLMGPGADHTIGAEGYMSRERKFFLRRKLTDVNYIRRSEETRRVYNPQVIPLAKLEGVDEKGVHYYHNGIHKTMPYDVLIYSGAKKKNDELFEAIEKIAPVALKIGDCDKIGSITTAIQTANEAVRRLPF